MPFSNTETLLNNEINWLKKIKDTFLSEDNNEQVDELLLDGHLGITKEFLLFQTAENKFSIGSDPSGLQLINDFVEHFVFPSSFILKRYRESLTQPPNGKSTNFKQLLASKSLKPICASISTVSALELLVSL